MNARTGGDRYGLIGYPVSHSFSPAIFKTAFEACGILASYDLFPIPPQDLSEGLAELVEKGVKGVNVTVPHKTAIIPLLNNLDESARLAGAVNTIEFRPKGLWGHNTDMGGFVDSLSALGAPDVKGKRVVVLGAGGAARAVVVSLARLGASRVIIANRDVERIQGLLLSVAQGFPLVEFTAVELVEEQVRPASEGAVLCVQATSLGLRSEDPVPADPGLFPRNCFLFDLVYGEAETPFVRRALNLGYQAVDGKEMLLRQAARTFSIWIGREAPLDAMRQAMNERISSPSG